MRKEILLTPGPTHVPPAIVQAMQQPTLHHRTDAFKRHFVAAREGLKWLTRSSTDPIFIAGSGTAAMEASLVNTCSKGDQVLVINAGKFGERWVKICDKLGLVCHQLTAPCGSSVMPDEIEDFLKSNNKIKALCFQYCETSTTAQLPVSSICQAAKKAQPEILTIVDAVSALATLPIYVDQQQIDILVAAGHKGLMLPPGLAMIVLNDAAWKVVEKNPTASLYFDLLSERKASLKDTTAWTPAMNHIVGLSCAIDMIRTEGEEAVYERHLNMANATRNAVQAIGCKLMAPNFPSSGVTGAYLPEGCNAEEIRKIMYNEYGVRVAGGQDELKSKVIRIGHMGYTGKSDIIEGIAALERALNAGGFLTKPGEGAQAVLNSFAQ